MIQVNLLPPEKRPPEGTSPARLTAIILGIMIPVLGLLLDLSYIQKTKEMNEDAANTEAKNTKLNGEIAALTNTYNRMLEIDHKREAIEDLRKNRMLWGRFHYRFFQMMTALDQADTQQQENNVIVRRFGLRKESTDKYNIDLGVMVLGNNQEMISRRQAEFMNIVDRYTGAAFMENAEVVRLAAELQGIRSSAELTDKEAEGATAIDLQRKLYEKRQAEVDKRVADTKKKYRIAWEAKFKSEAEPTRVAHIDGMFADADELLRINNFSGLIYEKIAVKRYDPTPVDYPSPKAGTEFVNPQKEASKVDFKLSFRVSTLVPPK